MEVFAPQRRLLLEGSVHLVTFNKKGQRVEEQVWNRQTPVCLSSPAHEPCLSSLIKCP